MLARKITFLLICVAKVAFLKEGKIPEFKGCLKISRMGCDRRTTFV